MTLHGQLPRERLFQLLEEADAFLLPSTIVGTWQENQACVVQEAMLMKTPVIATATGGVPESLAPDLHDYLVRPSSRPRWPIGFARWPPYRRRSSPRSGPAVRRSPSPGTTSSW